MDADAWKQFLMHWSEAVLGSELAQSFGYLIAPEMIATRWLGYPGATEEQIVAAETRLGTQLPPSYRTFLSVTNGWTVLTNFAGLLWSTDQINWLRDSDPEIVAIWTEDPIETPDAKYFIYGPKQNSMSFRSDYFRTGLQISNPRYLDGEFYMLNPQVRTAEGEWEAWFFASWRPGASRYRSFQELMQHEYQRFLRLAHR